MAHNAATEARYERQRRRAFFEDVLAVLRQRPNDLVSYEKARKAMRATQQLPETTEEIPLDKIVGSVGRYKDFTRAFLPRQGASAERWKRLDAALSRMETLPPIEVFQLGDVYFVRDGNHRVSVARANGLKYIEAYVTRVASRVPVTAGLPDEMESAEEYGDFLAKTNLDRLRPQQRIHFSSPGHFRTLLEHIAVHRYFMGLERRQAVSYEEAVCDWYDTLYAPIVAAIRRNNILDDFPGRTEADLYLWIIDHHYYLSQRYGAGVSTDEAAEHFARRYGGSPLVRLMRGISQRARRAWHGFLARVQEVFRA